MEVALTNLMLGTWVSQLSIAMSHMEMQVVKVVVSIIRKSYYEDHSQDLDNRNHVIT